MKLFILFLSVAWFVLAVAEPAHAGPLLGIPALFSAFAATAFGKVVLGIAFNIGASLLQKVLGKKPEQKPVGVKLDIEIGDDIPVSAVVGFYATAGKRKYVGTWGKAGDTPNAYLTEVVELGNLPGQAVSGLWIDDARATLLPIREPAKANRGQPIKEFRVTEDDGNIVDFAWAKFYDGTQTAADPFLQETFGDDEDRPWLSTMIGRGVPYAIMTYRYKPKFFNTVPAGVFESRGIALYDIRKDSTNGGNGPQRWGDQSTWEPSVNAAVIIYNIIRGMLYNGEWFFGGQSLAAHRLPASNWIAAANECSRLIQIEGQTPEPQFRAGLEITGDMEPLEVLDHLRAACNARIAEVGGSFKIQVGAFGAAVSSITDADIVVTEGQSYEPFPSLDDTVNQINISYPNPDEKWGTKDGPALTAMQLIDDVTGKTLFEVDGNRVLAADVQLPAVPYGRQAQRIRRAMIKEERRFRTHRFYLPPEAWVLEAGIDVITWSSDRNGYTNKRFLVTDIQGEATMNQLVTIREIDPADYDWSPDFELPTSSGYLGRLVVPPQPMEGWTVSATTILDATGLARRPAILVTSASNLDDIRNVRVRARLKASGKVVFDSDRQPYDVPYAWTISGAWLLPATEYEVQGKLIPQSASRDTLWSSWLPVTTPDVRFSAEDFHLLEITQAVQSELSKLQDWIWRDTNIRAVLDQARALGRSLAEQDLANFTDKQQLRRELSSTTGALKALFAEQITIATGPNSALASKVTTLTAQLDEKVSAEGLQSIVAQVVETNGTIAGLVSSVNEINAALPGKASAQALNVLTATVTDQGGDISSQATLLNSLTAQVGEVSADARLRFEVVNSNGSGYSTIGLQSRFGTSDSYRTAGLFVKVPSDPNQPTSVIVNANLFAVSAGDENGAKIFAVDAQGVYLDTAYIRNIRTDKITFLDESVLTSALHQNAAHAFYIDSNPGSIAYTTTGDKGTAQPGIDIEITGADVIDIKGLVRLRQTQAGATSVELKLVVNGTVVDTDYADFSVTGRRENLSVDYSVAGAGTKQIRLIFTINSISGQITRDRYRLTALHLKKGATT